MVYIKQRLTARSLHVKRSIEEFEQEDRENKHKEEKREKVMNGGGGWTSKCASPFVEWWRRRGGIQKPTRIN